MKRGGYKIIDFRDVDILTNGGATVTGIYEEIEKRRRKAILISGITIDGVEKSDCFVDCEVSGSNYTFTAYGKTFTITNADKVTIA
jgi:hypothetical protein